MARRLIVEIAADTDALEKGFRKAERETARFGKSVETSAKRGVNATVAFKGLGRQLFGAAASIELARQGLRTAIDVTEKSISAASDLNEQMSKTRTVFGNSARGIVAWSKTTASAFGISRRAALGTASSFGALFTPLGITGKEAAKQSRALTELGADLASFYNTDVQSALDAIRSGLVGESEPLRQYGVLLSEARVQAQAMADTGKKSARALTNQEKALARIKIIFQDTAQAQGDFARTSDGLANQSRTLTANLDDLETKIGSGLTPVLTDATGALNNFLESFSQSGTAANDFVRAMGAVGSAASTVGSILGKIHFGEGLRQAFDAIPGVGQIDTTLRLVQKLRDIYKNDPGGARAGPLGGAVEEARIKAARGLALQSAAQTLPPPGPTPATAAQRNKWFDAMIGRREDRVQDVKTLQGQLSDLRSIAALISARMKITKDVTRRLALEDQLLDVHRQEQSILDTMKANTQDAIDQRKELEKQRKEREQQRREAMADARAARQFRTLGLGPTGGELVPQLPNLKKRLASLRQAVKGTALDTRGLRAQFRQIAKVLAEGPNKVREDVRSAIDNMFDGIAEKLKEGTGGGIRAAGFRKYSVAKFVESLGLTLTPADKLRLEQGLATTGSGLSVPGAHSTAFVARSSGVVINGGLNLHGVQNMRELESEITRRAKSRPQPRRGGR